MLLRSLDPKLGSSAGSRMNDPISQDLREAFQRAVELFHGWRGAVPEPQVSLNRSPVEMSGVCGLVASFPDKLPEGIVSLLLSYMYAQHDTLRNDLERNPTYATGARCLLALIAEKKDRYRAKN